MPVIVRYHLAYHNSKLTITDTQGEFLPLFVDFASKENTYRRLKGGGFKQALAKAVGVTSKYKPTVLDTTAGLGGDVFVLACLGCRMHLIEQSCTLASIVQDGIARALQNPELKPIIENIQSLTIGNALKILETWDNNIDVIYIDPMFPAHQKSALVKKEMRIVKTVLEQEGFQETDLKALLAVAREKAQKRVVVKRPIHAPILEIKKTAMQFSGKTTRFDVYLL